VSLSFVVAEGEHQDRDGREPGRTGHHPQPKPDIVEERSDVLTHDG
jgi:hypothetical protein